MADTIAGQTHIEPDGGALASYVALWLAEHIAASAGPFRLSLSGGSTPKALYGLLAQEPYGSRVEWEKVEFYFGDERFVPHDHPDSNFRMANEALLSHIAGAQVYPMPTDTSVEDCAARYGSLMKQRYGAAAFDPARPFFDVMLLGLGDDGHTASLIPGQPVLEERTKWVAPVLHGRDEQRITLTYPALESSRTITFLVTGAGKAQTVARVRGGDNALPAARIQPHGAVMWFLDSAAAG
ncbi:MAG TPA: 6-phosphogluconolactonase [Rhizomicrobium sp.]|jgi:6-phosphogluconolactonase